MATLRMNAFHLAETRDHRAALGCYSIPNLVISWLLEAPDPLLLNQLRRNTPTATATIDGCRLSGYSDGRLELSRPSATMQLGVGVIRVIERVSEGVTAVAQRAETTFVDVPSLRVIARLPGLLIGFDDSHRILMTETHDDGHVLSWWAWPTLEPVCRMVSEHTEGAERAQFGAVLRYAAVYFDSRYPLPDSEFPIDPAHFERDRTTPYVVELYDLSNCTRVDAFAERRLSTPGRFSSDARLYEELNPRGSAYPSHHRFNLVSRHWEDK